VAKNSANRGVLVKTIEAAFKHFQLYKTINEKEQLYRSIFNSSFQFNAILTPEGVLLDGNRTGVNFFGLDVKDYIGHPFWEVPTWKGKEDGLKEAVKEASQGQLVRYKLEVPSLTALAIVDFSLKPVLDKDGKIILLIAEGRDITKYKNIEEKLRQREETFAKYFYKNSNAMTISNIEQGIILDVNDKFIENFGFTKEEVIGKSSLDLPLWLNPQDRLNAIAKLEQDGGVYNFETKLLTKQRDTRDVLFSWAIIEENGRNVLMSSVTDITELNIYREQMQTQQRIESLGVLAAGIAHDFNNLLMGISGNLSLVQYKISEDSPLLPYVNVALDAVYKATGLTGQLRTFAKGDQPRKKMILLQNELSSWIRFSLSGSSNIRLNLLIAENLWPTNVDVGQLNQVVNNLVINAVQAMSNGGNFSVIAKNIEQQDEIPEGLEPGAYILLSFEDSGSGISPENMSKIFDPFFTTKKNGNGLGLATAYSIINKHGGQLIVDSKVNKERSSRYIFRPGLTRKYPQLLRLCLTMKKCPAVSLYWMTMR
jgi:PAS domain S-box-containing protein